MAWKFICAGVTHGVFPPIYETRKTLCLGISHPTPRRKVQFSFSVMSDSLRLLWTVACQASLSSFQFSHSVVSDSLQPHGLQDARLPCPSPTRGACSDSCPSSQWCHPTISSSVIPFSSYLQSFPASGSFQMSQFFASGGQSIGISASTSVLPRSIQDWFPLGWIGLISFQSKGKSDL